MITRTTILNGMTGSALLIIYGIIIMYTDYILSDDLFTQEAQDIAWKVYFTTPHFYLAAMIFFTLCFSSIGIQLISKKQPKSTQPALSLLFTYIGTLMIVAGIVFSVDQWTYYKDTGAYDGLTIFLSSFLSGLFFIGFGKVIELLNDIKNK